MKHATFTHQVTVLTPETYVTSLNQATGMEISQARKRNGMTLAALYARVPFDTTPTALAAYELGNTPLSIRQFVDICETIDVLPSEILDAAIRQHNSFIEQLPVHVDLHLVHHSTRARFLALKPWARRQLSAYPSVLTMDLPVTTVSSLANRIDLPHHAVAQHLAGCYPGT
jgi:hypothetical protein